MNNTVPKIDQRAHLIPNHLVNTSALAFALITNMKNINCLKEDRQTLIDMDSRGGIESKSKWAKAVEAET